MIVRQVGKGAFGTVWEAIDNCTLEKVAIKHIVITGNPDEETE